MNENAFPPRPHDNCYWVAPWRLLAGEYPGAQDPEAARARLRGYLDTGVTHFIDLTEPGELAPYAGILQEEAAARGVDIVHERHALRDVSVPETSAEMEAILDAIQAGLDAGHTVYVHCWGGVGRTGTVVGCWLVRQGMSGPQALRQLAAWWEDVAKAWRHPETPETPAQREYVLDWQRA